METNESILTKGIVALDDRKTMGKVGGVVVDCDTCSVSYYIVAGANAGIDSVLPFDKTLSSGDTFIMTQSSKDFLPATDLAARGILEGRFDLVGLSVYSRAGSLLGTIKSFEIETTFGKIGSISLGEDVSFDQSKFVFFSPDFVFVDDGTEVDADLRASK